MVKRDTVKSLAQLRQRKQELQLEMEVTKREMAHGMGVMRNDLQSFLLTRVALPLGGGILGLYLVKKFFFNKQTAPPPAANPDAAPQRAYTPPPRNSSSSINLGQIIKIAVPIIQAALGFFAGYQKKEEEVEG